MLFLVLVFVFDLFKFSAAILEKGLLQTCISEVCKEDALKRIQKSPYVGLMLDESLDIAVQKKLVLFFKILVEGKSKIEFATNVK